MVLAAYVRALPGDSGFLSPGQSAGYFRANCEAGVERQERTRICPKLRSKALSSEAWRPLRVHRHPTHGFRDDRRYARSSGWTPYFIKVIGGSENGRIFFFSMD